MAACNLQASTDTPNIQGISVCHVISGDLWGGAEAQAFGLIQELSKRCQVQAIVFNEGDLYKRMLVSNIKAEVANEKTMGFFKLLFRAHSLLRKSRPNLIHVHGIKENLIAGLAAWLLGIPVVRTHHGKGMLGSKKRYNYVEQFSASFLTDSTISVSADLAQFLRQCGLKPRRLHIIKNGIKPLPKNNCAESETTQPSPKEHRFTVGTVGRLVSVKNHKCLIDAVKLATTELDSLRLVIVGDGPLAKQLEQYATDFGIADKIHFTGFQQDVASFMRSFDVFVMSSRHEGVPMSLLEAMSMNIPVVCTDVGGIPEVITHERNGLLVSSNDAMMLSKAILRIASDRTLTAQLVSNARDTVAGELSFDKCIANTISLYSGLVSQ